MNASVVELQSFGAPVTLAELDMGSTCEFLAWGSATFLYGSAGLFSLGVWKVDGELVGNDQNDDSEPFMNQFSGIKRGAFRGRGRSITFRLLQVGGTDLYGVGCVVMLDRSPPRFGRSRKPFP